MKGEICMLNEMIDRLVLGKRYQLQEIYELMKDYCIQNSIDDWKHKIRAQLEEKKGTRTLRKYQITYYGDCTYSIE